MPRTSNRVRTKPKGPPLTSSRALSSSSPLISADLPSLLARFLSPAQWSTYTPAQREHFISLFPEPYRTATRDSAGQLLCPVVPEWVKEDEQVKRSLGRWKRDLEGGYWEERWRKSARRAGEERRKGKFDEFETGRVERLFGTTTESPEIKENGGAIEAGSESKQNGHHGTPDEDVDRLKNENNAPRP